MLFVRPSSNAALFKSFTTLECLLTAKYDITYKDWPSIIRFVFSRSIQCQCFYSNSKIFMFLVGLF